MGYLDQDERIMVFSGPGGRTAAVFSHSKAAGFLGDQKPAETKKETACVGFQTALFPHFEHMFASLKLCF